MLGFRPNVSQLSANPDDFIDMQCRVLCTLVAALRIYLILTGENVGVYHRCLQRLEQRLRSDFDIFYMLGAFDDETLTYRLQRMSV